jgi:heparan-alpha-glucosaminide N-acetyltransferase
MSFQKNMTQKIPGRLEYASNNRLPARLYSIDLFRALTMFLMIFVNDVDAVKNIPAWIGHVASKADGLGFADTIFPAFLFIVGLSLPFAIKKRLTSQASYYKAITYIVTRSLALIIMGFLQVNLENYNHTAILPKAVWEILITIGFFLVWLDYPPNMNKIKRRQLQVAGVLLLVIMAYLFKGGEDTAPVWLKPYWWGILGIIGWAYLVCASLFLLSKGKFWIQVGLFAIFLIINILVSAAVLKFSIPIVNNASATVLTMAGVVISLLYTKLIEQGKSKILWISLTLAGIVMICFGLLERPYTGGISKIHATTPWVAICMGISILVFELLIYLVDLKSKRNWARIIRPAGTSTLTCYLIPYLLYSFYILVGFNYPAFLNEGVGGIVRSFVVAFFLIFIAGLLEKRRLRLKI